MMDLKSLKQVLPYLAAILIFIVLSFAFMSPVLQGKKLKQHDITVFKGMSKEISDFRTKTGEEPLWTNGMFGGMPSYQISTLYPNNWVNKIDKVFKLGLPHPVNLMFLYFIGFFILLIVLEVDPWLAIIGSFAFAFSSYFIIILGAGHNSKAHAIAYMAPIVAGIILTYRGKYLLGGILTALFAALEITANHLQITYYLLFFILILVVSILIDHLKRKAFPNFIKASGVLLIAAILAVLPNITNLLVTSEYSAQSMRGTSELVKKGNIQTSGLDKDYATQWSYGISESLSLLFPNVKGGASGALAANENAMEHVDPRLKNAISQNRISSYWGDQPFMSGPTYAGAIIVFLFILGLFYLKGYLKWALVAGTIFSIVLAWGKNFMPVTEFFLDYVPLYNKFRAVSMILILAEFTIPILAILTLWKIIKEPKIIQTKKKEFLIAFGLSGGLLLIFYFLPNVFFNFLSQMEADQLSNNTNPQVVEFVNNIEAARISIFKSDAIRSFMFILLIAIALYTYSLQKINKSILLIITAVLLLADMFTVNKRFINDENFERRSKVENPYTPSLADNSILADKSLDYRVLNLGNPFNDGATSYFHKSIGGYHSAKLGRYQDLIDFRLQAEINQLTTVLQNPDGVDINNQLKSLDAINMLNTKYIIYNPEAAPIENPYANGNAWFVNKYELVENANEEMNRLATLDTKTIALVDKRFENQLHELSISYKPDNSIHLIDYQPNHLIYKTKTDSDQLAVFSEIYYDKGWNAYIDGELAPYFRSDYTLRAMVVPAGIHTIEFRFLPESYYFGEKIALLGSILLFISLIGIVTKELIFYFKYNRLTK